MSQVAHFEFTADDTQRARAFFEGAFGWRFEKWEGGAKEYWLVSTGGPGEEKAPGIDGGMGSRQQMHAGVVNIIDVENVDAELTRITAAGGEVAVPKQAIPGTGWVAYFTDPEGSLWGVCQEDERTA